MLKNKIIVRKIRNIVILLMAMAIMVGAYRNIDRSRAEDVKEISAIALDNYGYLEKEHFKLEAKQVEDGLYEVVLPESINTKKINQIVKIGLGELESTTTQITETILEDGIELVENRIYLTKEQIENQQINLEIAYDVAIIEEKQEGEYNKILLSEKSAEERIEMQITEETKTLYSKVLRYEDEANNKLVELKGYLPKDAELQVEEVAQEKLTQIFGNKKIEVAYDIKILTKVVTTVPIDENNPDSEPEEIIETIEISPEEFGEKCEVLITDVDIVENSQVYHVKEDNSYEEVNVKENSEGNISFEAETFSIYAVSSREGTNVSDDIGIQGEVNSSNTTGTTSESNNIQLMAADSNPYKVAITDVTSTSFSVVLLGAPTSISRMAFAVWPETSGQGYIKWYFVSGSETFVCNVDIANHGNITNERYIVHIYQATDSGTHTGDVLAYTAAAVSSYDTTPPTYTSREIKNVSKDGYDVYVYGVSDTGSGVNRVQFPVWTDTIQNGSNQDDLEQGWEISLKSRGTNMGDGTWYYRVNTSQHNNEEAMYNTHIYIYDKAGNYRYIDAGYHEQGKTYVDRTAPIVDVDDFGTGLTADGTDAVFVTLMDTAVNSSYASGLATGIQFNYGWSTSSSTMNGSYTLLDTNNAATSTTEKYYVSVPCPDRSRSYLWIKPANNTFKDKNGNIQTQTFVITVTWEISILNGLQDIKIENPTASGYDIYVKLKSEYENSFEYLTFPTWHVGAGTTYIGQYLIEDRWKVTGPETSGTYAGYWKFHVDVPTISAEYPEGFELRGYWATAVFGKWSTGGYQYVFDIHFVELDTVNPVVSVSPTTHDYTNSAVNVNISLTDDQCDISGNQFVVRPSSTGMANYLEGRKSAANSLEYYLSNSATALSGGSWKTYASGTSFDIKPSVSGTYYMFVKRVQDVHQNISDSEGTAVTISGTTYQRFGPYYFDFDKPTPATLNMKKGSSSGSAYTNNTWTNQSVYIALNNDATDAHSGVASSTYTIKKGSTTIASEQTGSYTLTDEGEYTITVTTKDKVGNSATSNTAYTVKIDKTVPTVPTYTAFHPADNASYTSGTWTNYLVHTTISSTDARSGIAKIQYSTDKTNWNTFSFSAGALTKSGTTWSGTEPWGLRDRNEYFYFKAVDLAGNESTVSSTADWNIRYDITKPSSLTYTTSYSDGTGTYTSGTWYNGSKGSVRTTISATDALSGISGIYYKKVGTTTWTKFGFAVSALTQSGTTWTGTENWGLSNRNDSYDFKAIDKAGNEYEMTGTPDWIIRYDTTIPTISVNNTSCTWRNSAYSVTITAADTGGSSLTSTTGEYFLSTSASPTAVATGSSLSGTYTSGTAFSINPGTSGQYYLFVKEISDNATNKSSTTNYVTIGGVKYHRYGTYQFDYDKPTWQYSSKDIYYSTANDAGNDEYANKERTVVITFTGQDALIASGNNIVTSTLTKDDISVLVNGTAVTGITKTLDIANNTTTLVTGTLTIKGITGDGPLTISIPSGKLKDVAQNSNIATTLTTEILDIDIDNTSPNLAVKVTNPTANGAYKAGQTITITSTYNENIYKEITSNTLIDTTAEAPTLSLTFGGVAAKGTVACSTVSANVFTYTYTITAGDNGSLKASVATVYDAAGNSISATNSVPTGYTINADTQAPTITVNTTSTGSDWYNSAVSLTVTGTDPTVNGYTSGISSTTGNYFLSTSETPTAVATGTSLSGTYTNGTAFTINPGTSGQYYLFVKAITDNAKPTGNVSSTANEVTINGVKYQRYGQYNFDYDKPTIAVTPETTGTDWYNTGLSVKITLNDAHSGVASNSGNYFLSTSATPTAVATGTALSGTYTSGTAFTINPGTSGQYYLFVKAISDKAKTTGNVSSTANEVTIGGVTYHRYGLYQFDYDLPVWSYVSKDIYYSTANDAGNDNYANKDRTVKIVFKGTDVTTNATSTLTSNDIAVTVNGTAVANSNKTLETTSNGTQEVTCTLTITGITGDGTLNVVIPAGKLTDQATNTNVQTTLTTDVNITIDNTNPNLSFAVTSPAAGYYKAGQVITITATYNENVYKEVTSNTLIDTTAEAPAMTLKFGGANAKNTVSCTARSGNVFTYTYTIKGPTTTTGTDGDNGAMTISLATVYDRAGNAISASNVTPSVNIVADTIAPTVTSITANRISPTNASSITYTVTFSETVTGFAASDVTVNSGKGSVTSVTGSGTTWSVVVSTTDNQEYTETITVKANGATIDRAGNKIPTAKTSDGIVVDRIDPTWTYVSKDIYLTNPNDVGNDNYANADRTVVIVFKGTDANSHNVTSTLTSDLIAVSVNGTAVANSNKTLETTSNGTQEATCTLTITGITGDGTLNVVIPAGNLTDQATNTNIQTTLTTSVNITIDNTNPNLSFAVTSPATGTYKAGQVITITATYNDTNIGAGIFKDQKSTTPITTANAPAMTLKFGNTAARGTATCTAVNGKVLTYQYTIQGATTTGGTDGDNGVLKITSLGTVYDAAGNSISQTTEVTPSPQITADTILPTVTITANKTSYTNASNITYTFTFSENVTGFTADDVTVVNGTKGTFTAVSETVYTLVVSTIDDRVYTETVSVSADKAVDIAGNGNIASSSFTLNVDRKDPIITVTPDKTTNASANDYQKSQSVTITVTDEGAGLLSSNSYQYFLSNSSTTLSGGAWTGGTWTNYTSGTPFTIGTGLTGNYYLFVKTVKDNVTDTDKNVSSSQGNMTAISGYHMFGTYKFDNTNPYWEIGTPDISTANKKVTVDLIGTDAHSGYGSNTLDISDIEVWVDGTKITNVTKVLSTASTVTEGIKYTLTLSNFEETVRQSGKNFKEWSGSTKIVILANSLEDNLENKNTSDEFSLGHVDFIKPEFTYKSSNTTIGDGNHGDTKKVTVIFDVTDKYFTSTTLSTNTNASLITVKVDNADVNANITKALAKKTIAEDVTENGVTYKANGDIYYTVNGTSVKVGERYQLEITGLDKGDGFTYSGPMTLAFGAGVITDESGNTSDGTIITIGVDENDGNANATAPSGGVVVDVVDPIWVLQSVDLDTATIKIRAKDKYYSSSNLQKEDITIYVNGATSTAIVKTLTGPVEITAGQEYEYTMQLSNIVPVGGGYTSFEPTNKAQLVTGADGFKYRSENGGNVSIEIAGGTITDNSGNQSNATPFEIGNIDGTKPEIYDVQKTQNASAGTVTFIFNVTDRNYDSSDLITEGEITTWMDGIQTTSITKSSFTYKEIKAVIDDEAERVVGHQYTLVLSDIVETSAEYAASGRQFQELSGTLQIKIAQNAAKDMSGNTLNTDTTTITDFVDYIKPELLYQYTESSQATPGDIDYDGKTFTMVFDIIDKYINASTLTVNDFTILIDGELPGDDNGNGVIDGTETSKIIATPTTAAEQNANKDKVWKNLTVTDIEADSAFNKTVSGAFVNDTHVIGKRFTLVLSNLEQLQIKSGDQYLDYSGVITVGIPANKVTDTKGNVIAQTTITSGIDIPGGAVGDSVIVDVVDPLWQKVSSSASAIDPTTPTTSTATITVKGTDKYYASSTLTDKLKVYVHEVGAAAGTLTDVTSSVNIQIDPTVTPIYKVGTTDVQVGAEYTITITGFAQNINQVKLEILEDAMLDVSGNGNKATKFMVYNTLELTNTETAATSRFLGESSIQRQNIQKVVFVNSTANSTAAGVRKVWDASAAGDNSILAWYSETSAPYTVYIGSNDEIFANQNSSYLFSYIGYATNCTAEDAVVNLNLLNENSVTNMSYMFNNCGFRSMTSLNLSEFNTKYVTNMSHMFNGCGTTAMTTFSLGNSFYTSEVTDMTNMFNGCGQNGITTFTLGSNFNTAKVQNMSGMFQNFGHKLTSLNLGEYFYTSEVTDMSNMFNGTGKTSMTSLTLGNNFDTSKVTTMSGMFQDCGTTALTSLDLGNIFYTSEVTDMSNMFNGCGTTAMTTLDLGPVFASIPSTNTDMFANCGTTDLTIYASEAIYKNRNELKSSNIVNNETMVNIYYDANGGTGAPATQAVTKGQTVTLSTTIPTRDGYNFLGWATTSTATSKEYDAGGTFTTYSNTTLYAVWKRAGVSPSTIFDSAGTNAAGLHIGDFVNYDAGKWTATEIASIQTGLESSPVTANGSSSAPTNDMQFGGFYVNGSRNGNVSGYSYIKDASTGSAITGWRVFDIENDGTVVLISAGNPETFFAGGYTNSGYIGEYILTENVNYGWSNPNTSSYRIREWDDYVNEEQNAVSAVALSKTALDAWFSKYIVANANTYSIDTLWKIYRESAFYKYQNIVDNNSGYWLATGDSYALWRFNEDDWVINCDYDTAYGIRVLVKLSPDVRFSTERTGTKTLTGGRMNEYGGNQTYNVWDIK